jgi:outer membrane protein TolC
MEAAESARGIAAGRLLPLAEKRRAEADAIYRSGESDLVDVLLAEGALRGALLRVLEFESRAASARIRLMRAAGGSVPGTGSPSGGSSHGER